jgi:hypothetical protein
LFHIAVMKFWTYRRHGSPPHGADSIQTRGSSSPLGGGGGGFMTIITTRLGSTADANSHTYQRKTYPVLWACPLAPDFHISFNVCSCTQNCFYYRKIRSWCFGRNSWMGHREPPVHVTSTKSVTAIKTGYFYNLVSHYSRGCGFDSRQGQIWAAESVWTLHRREKCHTLCREWNPVSTIVQPLASTLHRARYPTSKIITWCTVF